MHEGLVFLNIFTIQTPTMPTIKLDLNSIERLIEYKQTAVINSIFDYISIEIKRGNSVLFERRQENFEATKVFHSDLELTSFYDRFLEEKKPFFSKNFNA